jgi:uncharacterized small protein (DUF1192 family)
MGYASLREDILERLTEALSSLLRDEERRKRRRSTAEEEARLEAIKRVQSEIRRVLDEHLDIATTPGIELAQRVKDLEARISALTDEVERAKHETIEERTRTQAALQQVAKKDADIAALKKENERLEMKVAFLSVRDNHGRGGPEGSRRS